MLHGSVGEGEQHRRGGGAAEGLSRAVPGEEPRVRLSVRGIHTHLTGRTGLYSSYAEQTYLKNSVIHYCLISKDKTIIILQWNSG